MFITSELHWDNNYGNEGQMRFTFTERAPRASSISASRDAKAINDQHSR